MQSPAYPADEAQRIAALNSYAVLDTACEASFDNIAELAAMLTRSPISAVSLIDSGRQWFKARVGMDVTETPREVSFCAHAILDPHVPFIVPDARQDARFADNPLVAGPFGLRFYAGIPLVNAENAVLGTLCVIDRVPRVLTALELTALTRLADSVMTTLELRRAMGMLHRCALSDSLTGLPNRAALLTAIATMMARQRRHGGPFCLLLLDLDGFKAVNDCHGHAAGDGVLCEVADLLRATARGEDSVARLGGDEFAMLAVCDQAGAAALAARFQQSLAMVMGRLNCAVTASVGIVCLHEPPSRVEDALRRADAAMYDAKAAGKNRIVHAGGKADRLRQPAAANLAIV